MLASIWVHFFFISWICANSIQDKSLQLFCTTALLTISMLACCWSLDLTHSAQVQLNRHWIWTLCPGPSTAPDNHPSTLCLYHFDCLTTNSSNLLFSCLGNFLLWEFFQICKYVFDDYILFHFINVCLFIYSVFYI